ncbi:MAG: hypothetical protein ABI968_14700, partial [Acidobacteriota bacterium]
MKVSAVPGSSVAGPLALAVMLTAGLMLALPLFFCGFPKLSQDGAIHAAASSRFASQLWNGEAYPRWIQDMNGGLGSVIRFYYLPFAYYAAAVFRRLFANDEAGWRPLGLSAGLALAGSGVAVYF